MDAVKKQKVVDKLAKLLAKEKVLKGLGPTEQRMLVDRARELAERNIVGQAAFVDIVKLSKKLQKQKGVKMQTSLQ